MPDYTLYYWPIPFRGHFIRYILAHVGADWDEPGFAAINALKGGPVADQPYPFMAPPLLHDHGDDSWLSQLPAICMALGQKHGLVTEPDQTLRLICDASDILGEITLSHGAQMWDREKWETFITNRLPRWMQMHERIGRDHGLTADAGYVFASEAPGLADLTLAALWHTMIDKLPGLRPVLRENAPSIEGLVDRIAARQEIAALLAAWPDPLYCAGKIEESIRAMLDG